MKRFLALLLLPIMGFATTFLDPQTGLTLELPNGYNLDLEESFIDPCDGSWFYTFLGPDESELTIEIDEYDETKSLPEHFHISISEDDEDDEGWKLISEGIRFKDLEINGRKFTQCQIRFLAMDGEYIEPIYISDYLFVNGKYGFSVSLMAEDESFSKDRYDEIMTKVLNSINFTGDEK